MEAHPGLFNVYVTQAPSSIGQPPQAPSQPSANAKPIVLASVPVNFNGVPYGSSLVSLQFRRLVASGVYHGKLSWECRAKLSWIRIIT